MDVVNSFLMTLGETHHVPKAPFSHVNSPTHQRHQSTRTIAMLLLTLAVTVSWGPNILYYAIVSFAPSLRSLRGELITDNMIILQSVFDPILLGIVFREVRRIVFSGFRHIVHRGQAL